MNVLLVDDLPSIIDSLVSCIPWHQLGIASVYTAGSAAEARNVMNKKTVDILISDIEMPGEDGLGLLTWVREQKLDVECIFLTAHADFFYAKRAISLNVSDYIIQPARDEDLVRAVKKAVANRRTANTNEELIRYQGQDFSVKNGAIQSMFEEWPTFQEIVLEPERLEIQLRRLGGFHLKCSAKDPCVLLFGHLRIWRKMPLSPAAFFTVYRRILDGTFPDRKISHFTWFPGDDAFYTVLFSPLTEQVQQALANVYSMIEPEIGCALRMVYCGSDLKHIRESIATLSSRETQFGIEHSSDEVCFLRVQADPHSWETDPLNERNRHLLQKIKDYIHSNMAEPITRTQIAEALSITPSYVSHLIKALEDLNCKELITKLKMEYAQKLLLYSKCAIGDIAIQCGYDSFAYFSKVYRQTYGITPSMERENHAK